MRIFNVWIQDHLTLAGEQLFSRLSGYQKIVVN